MNDQQVNQNRDDPEPLEKAREDAKMFFKDNELKDIEKILNFNNFSKKNKIVFYYILAGKTVKQIADSIHYGEGGLRAVISSTITSPIKQILGIESSLKVAPQIIPTLLRMYLQINNETHSSKSSNPTSTLATEFINLDEMWQQLLNKATCSVNIKIKKYGNDLELGNYDTYFPLGTTIEVTLEVDNPGYLLLLEQATSGKVWVLSPSEYVPNPSLTQGSNRFPSQNSIHKSFQLLGRPGQETLLAVISKSEDILNWLQVDGSASPVSLQTNQLSELKSRLENPNNQCEILYKQFTVTL